jgi:hypothetical protein
MPNKAVDLSNNLMGRNFSALQSFVNSLVVKDEQELSLLLEIDREYISDHLNKCN